MPKSSAAGLRWRGRAFPQLDSCSQMFQPVNVRETRGVRQHRQNIVALKIFVVGQNLLRGHATG